MNTTTITPTTLAEQLQIVDYRITQALGIAWVLHQQQDEVEVRSPLQNALWALATLLEQAKEASEGSVRTELQSRLRTTA